MNQYKIQQTVFALTALITFATGCNSDIQVLKDAPTLVPADIRKPEVKPADYGLNYSQVMEFNQDVKGEFLIEGWVPDPGKAIISISALPAGATFDAVTSKLTWSPTHADGLDPVNPAMNLRLYKVKILIQSDQDSIASLEMDATLIARSSASVVAVATDSNTKTVLEGTTLEQKFTVTDADFPNGPFLFQATGLPQGAVIVAGATPNEYLLRYSPGIDAVTARSGTRPTRSTALQKKALITVKARNTRGDEVTSPQIVWTIIDVPQKAVVAGPAQVTSGADVAFSFSAIDLNGDAAPTIVLNNTPTVGTISQSDITNGSTRFITVRWNEIPANAIRDTDLVFQACLSTDRANCTEYRVSVKFTAPHRSPPTITRASWPASEAKYVRTGDTFSTQISATDADFPSKSVTIEITSTNETDRLTYDADSGKLDFHAGAPGYRQLTLVATSFQGVTTTEIFSAFVLPTR